MGKKKRKKLAKKVDTAIAKRAITLEDVLHAGIGVLADAENRGKKKIFRRQVERGRSVAAFGRTATADLMAAATVDPGTDRLRNPAIAYRPGGGGWYDIEIGEHTVGRVQGEDAAAKRAGQLLAAFAALSAEDQQSHLTGVRPGGGGWYSVHVEGIPVRKVRGREEAQAAFDEIAALNP